MAKQKTKLKIPIAINPDRDIRITTLNITNFMRTSYFDFACYAVVQRAVPSLVDGFKTGARKILHAALNGSAKKGTDIKSLNLVGDIMSMSGYDHGDASLYSTLLTLSSSHTDNLAPLFIKGQGGSLRDSKAAAPRYLYIRISKYTNLLYRKDYDILNFKESEGKTHEPEYYLPIIPTVLTSNTSGIGVAYAFSCMSYNPIDIIQSIREYITYGHVRVVRPYVKGLGINAKWFYKDEKWHNQGHYEIVRPQKRSDPYKIIVNELTFDKSFEGMEEHYNTLIETEVITDWINRSRGNNIQYELIFKNEEMFNAAVKDKEYLEIKILRNISKVDKNNLTVIDENGKIKIFQEPEELIEYFAKFRLDKYNTRKELMISKINARIERINMLLKFIQLFIDGVIVLSNRPLKSIKIDLDKHKIDHDVLSIPISRITKDEFDNLKQELKDIKNEMEYIKKTPIAEMYLNDLDVLEKELIEDFKYQDVIKLQIV